MELAKVFFRRYVMFISISPNCTEESMNVIMDSLVSIISKFNGTFEKYENLGTKPLAYTIAKNTNCIMIQCYFKLVDDKLLGKNVEYIKTMFSNRRNSNILRSLLLSITHNEYHFHSLKSFTGFDYNILK